MPVRIADIKAIDKSIRADLAYATDLEVHGVSERWSLPVNGREDCDGWMRETAINHLLRMGADPSDVAYAAVDVAGDPRPDHAVCLVHSDENGWVTCGDTAATGPTMINDLVARGWNFRSVMLLDKPGEWRAWSHG